MNKTLLAFIQILIVIIFIPLVVGTFLLIFELTTKRSFFYGFLYIPFGILYIYLFNLLEKWIKDANEVTGE